MTSITMFLLVYGHNGSHLLSVKSPVDMYLSWQVGLKFPLHVYKEQQEIPSEIKNDGSWIYLHPREHDLRVDSYK